MATLGLRILLIFALQILSAGSAKTCTKTRTIYTTVTDARFRTKSSDEPSVTYYSYSTTKFIKTPYTPVTNSQNPTGGTTNCNYYTGTDIPPDPSSSGVAPASSIHARELNEVEARDPAKCTTTTTTRATVTVKKICTATQVGYPPPKIVSRKGTLTTKIPDFCAGPRGYYAPGNVPNGDVVSLIFGYPYFPQNEIECCVSCSKEYPANFVAEGFIEGSLECQCLIDTTGITLASPGSAQMVFNRLISTGTVLVISSWVPVVDQRKEELRETLMIADLQGLSWFCP